MKRRDVLLVVAGCLCGSRPASSQFRLKDLQKRKGFVWRSARSRGFDYFFEPASVAELNIEVIQQTTERSRTRVLELLGEEAVPFRVQVFIVDSRERMSDLCGREWNGWANGRVMAIVYGDRIKALGAHEDCHLVAHSLWGRPRDNWLSEGLAVYSDDRWYGYGLHELCKHLSDRSKLIPMRSVTAPGWNKKYSDMITYPELGSIVKYMYEQHGMEAVKAVWKTGAKQIPRVFGRSLEELEHGWRARIAQSDASSVRYG